MIIIRAVVFLGSAALGLVLTSLLVEGFEVRASGFLVTVIVFAVIQSLLSPLITKLAQRRAPALLGGIGLVTTLLALLAAHFFTDGVQITGISAWVLATFLVWLLTALATLILTPLGRFVHARRTGRSKAGADGENPGEAAAS